MGRDDPLEEIEQQNQEVFVPLVHRPGEAQVDFGRGAPVVSADGKRRGTWVFRIILSHSRKGYSEAVYHQTTDEFLRCLENALIYFGGSVQTLVIDNLRAAVSRADWFDPELCPKVRSFAEHYGLAILPTKPRTPRHKGKIESGVKYVKNNALKGRTFATLADENQFLLEWEQTVADTRIHGTTRQQVGKLFEQAEKTALAALPADQLPAVIFVTAYDRHALRAFEVSATDYLLKPIQPARFREAVQRARQRLQERDLDALNERLRVLLAEAGSQSGFPSHMSVKSGSKTVFVKVSDVEYVEAAANYVILHAGTQSHVLRETLTKLESRLQQLLWVNDLPLGGVPGGGRPYRARQVRRGLDGASGEPDDHVVGSQAGGLGHVRDHHRNLNALQPPSADGLGDGQEVRSAAGEQDSDTKGPICRDLHQDIPQGLKPVIILRHLRHD